MPLKIAIPERWATEAEPLSIRCGQNEIQIFCDDADESSIPKPEHLEDIASGFGVEQLYGEVVDSSSAICTFGRMGTAIFHSHEFPRVQVWLLTNSRSLIWVIHICREEPSEVELSEARVLIHTLSAV